MEGGGGLYLQGGQENMEYRVFYQQFFLYLCGPSAPDHHQPHEHQIGTKEPQSSSHTLCNKSQS